MRELNLQEAELVAGGNDALGDRVERACPRQPDSRKLAVTYQPSTSAVTLTAKCVDYRRSLHATESEPEL